MNANLVIAFWAVLFLAESIMFLVLRGWDMPANYGDFMGWLSLLAGQAGMAMAMLYNNLRELSRRVNVLEGQVGLKVEKGSQAA